MNIYDYIQRCEKVYKLRMKFAVEIGDVEMDKIEKIAMRYNPIRIANPRKTIFQANPLDFPNIGGAEIYIIDLELSLPASTWVLAQEIQTALGIAEKFIVVHTTDSPIEIDLERIAAELELEEEAAKKNLNPEALLSQDDMNQSVESENGGDFYGAGRNSPLLAKLAEIEKERKEKSKVEPKNPLFTWLDTPKGDLADDFNRDIEGAPQVHPTGANAKEKIPGAPTWRKIFKKGGETVTITRKSEN